MNTCLDYKNGVKARKTYHCALCGEKINPKELYDKRTGIEAGEGFWVMRMHPECHAHESKKGTVDPDWYEDSIDPAFTRSEAIASSLQPRELEPSRSR